MVEILIGILWVIVGIWIAFKRDWYKEAPNGDESFCCWVSVIFAPINLIIVLFKVFVIKPWNKDTY